MFRTFQRLSQHLLNRSHIRRLFSKSKNSSRSTITTKGKSLVSLPCSPSWRACFVVQVASSSETSVLLSSWGKSSKLSVFVNRVANPVDSWVVADCGMSWIDQYYFKILVSRVLQYIYNRSTQKILRLAETPRTEKPDLMFVTRKPKLKINNNISYRWILVDYASYTKVGYKNNVATWCNCMERKGK